MPSTIDRAQALWWGVSTIGIGILLVGFWWVPFGLEQSYSNSMGYVNIHTYVAVLLPEADWWALVLAALAAVAAFVIRSRFGILMSLLAGLSALAVIFDPQATLYNVRFLPLWFLSIYLLVGWGVAAAVTGLTDLWTWWRYRPESPRAYLAPFTLSASDLPETSGLSSRSGPSWPVAGVFGPLVALLVAVGVVVTPFVVSYNGMLDLGITPGANQVTNWSSYNYKGYQNMAAYPEYRAVISTMEKVGKQYGCGQAMWQYDPSLGRFGTTMALMLLPYWSNGCIGSMEGLLFESSATTPYHFINQSELSVTPSEPQVGLDYSSLNVVAGIQHLQLLGVKYFMASSPQVQAEAAADPQLRQVASTGPWTSTTAGSTTTTTWDIYRILNSPEVVGLSNEPAVETGIKPGQSSWLQPSEDWYNNPTRWTVELAQSGPPSWPQVPIGDPNPPQVHCAQGQGDAGQGERQLGQLPRRPGGFARAGQGVLLSQLAGLRRHRPLPSHPESDGGRAHLTRRHAALRGHFGQSAGRAVHPGRNHLAALAVVVAPPSASAHSIVPGTPPGTLRLRPS